MIGTIFSILAKYGFSIKFYGGSQGMVKSLSYGVNREATMLLGSSLSGLFIHSVALDSFLPIELRCSQKENISFLYHFWLYHFYSISGLLTSRDLESARLY